MTGLLMDLRHSVRSVRAQPKTMLTIALTMALGIGATTAAFSLINSVLLRPLPFRDPDRIVTLLQMNVRTGVADSALAPANFRDIRDDGEVFELVAGHVGLTRILTGVDEPESVNGIAVSPELFPLLGADALIGRTLGDWAAAAQDEPVVLISQGLWARRLGSSADILDRSITLDGRSYRVLGVMPPGFDFPGNADFWVPLEQESRHLLGLRHIPLMSGIARLGRDVSIEAAQSRMDLLASQLRDSYPNTNRDIVFQVIRLQDFSVREARPALLLLLAATGILLLIACFNVANILIARAIDGRREAAVRLALGARQGRVISQFLCYSTVATLPGGALGILLAGQMVDSLRWLLPADYQGRVELDPGVLALSAGLTLAGGLVCGLLAARRVAPDALTPYLKEGPAGSTGRRDQNRMWDVLVVAEIALSLLLCMAAGLLVNSFIRLSSVDPGFETARLLTVGIALNQPAYGEDHLVIGFHDQILERLSSMPEIESAALATSLPLSGGYLRQMALAEGAEETRLMLPLQVVGGRYFETLGIPLLAGRTFSPDDREGGEGVAIINETASRHYFGGESPLGRTILLPDSGSSLRIVGVVGDVRQLALQRAPEAEVFLPYLQFPWTRYTLIVRTKGNPTNAASTIRGLIRSMDRNVPVTRIAAMEELLAGSVMDRRLRAATFNIFAVVGLSLAAVGLYGLLWNSVRRRTHEIGVRLAIGAAPSDILKMILRRGFALILTGMVIGLAASLYVNGFLAGFVYGISEHDPLTAVAVCGFILGTGLIACYIPAYRATRVDPIIALRAE